MLNDLPLRVRPGTPRWRVERMVQDWVRSQLARRPHPLAQAVREACVEIGRQWRSVA